MWTIDDFKQAIMKLEMAMNIANVRGKSTSSFCSIKITFQFILEISTGMSFTDLANLIACSFAGQGLNICFISNSSYPLKSKVQLTCILGVTLVTMPPIQLLKPPGGSLQS